MSRTIQWFVDNPIAANLLMVLIIIGGIFGGLSINREVFPVVAPNIIEISAAYPGAGPAEVEEQVTVRIEEAVADLDGIKELTSTSRQGTSSVSVEVESGYSTEKLLGDIKNRVDGIITFPTDVERPLVRDIVVRSDIMSLAITGNAPELTFKRLAERIRDELALIDGVGEVNLRGVRDEEMAIELSEMALRRYNLSFTDVVNAVKRTSVNMPAGLIRTDNGDIQVQTRGQAYTAQDFEKIVLLSRPDGSQLKIKDVAQVVDGFSENEFIARINGKKTITIDVKSSANPDVVLTVENIESYLDKTRQWLPDGMELLVWRDRSEIFKSRMNLLLTNGVGGLILVFILLMLFLRPLLAVWVCVGIAVAFLGAFAFMPLVGVSLNMLSLFAFLMILGIVVDDAIIVAESIYSKNQHGMHDMAAASTGAKQVSKPVVFAVLSTIIFFGPMLFIPGTMGQFAYMIPAVVILCLVFSLLESLWILPSHLSHLKPEKTPTSTLGIWFTGFRGRFSGGLQLTIDKYYLPVLNKSLASYKSVVALFFVGLTLVIAVIIGGWLRFSFMPEVESNVVNANLSMLEGLPFDEVERARGQLEAAAQQLRTDPDILAQNNGIDPVYAIQSWAFGTQVRAYIALTPSEERDIGAKVVTERWRELVGDIHNVDDFNLGFTINQKGKDIKLRMTMPGNDIDLLRQASSDIASALASYPGVFDVGQSIQSPRSEIELQLKPNAEVLGLGLSDVAQQVRQGFYGEEVQRIPRGKEDVRVLVRYTREERETENQLNELRLRTGQNTQVPLVEVAEVVYVPGYDKINRIDRRRSVNIYSYVRKDFDANAIVAQLKQNNLAQWQLDYPGLELGVAGDMESQQEFAGFMSKGFLLTIFLVYCLMAIAFKSYSQPFLILTAVPFGFVGAVLGHLIMGLDISMMSVLGFFAAAGVVVNDNLVLVDRVNQLRHQGVNALDAAYQAGKDRFRPIILTSLTTFAGLLPIMFEQSTQAQFLIPMVVSLAYGVVFATTVTLILVPCLYLAQERAAMKFKLGEYKNEVA